MKAEGKRIGSTDENPQDWILFRDFKPVNIYSILSDTSLGSMEE